MKETAPSLGSKANSMAWGITLAAGWLWTWRQLSLSWSAFPNYRFGYFVPWIALLLALRRIQDVPGCLQRNPPSSRARRFAAAPGVVAAWGLFLFAELIRQFDPHWRMVDWTMMASITLLTAIWLWLRGGEKLVWALAFPLGFTWTAVPWPTRIEEIVTVGLRTFVTKGAVAALHFGGIQAAQRGNVIGLANGSVVVDSACSGISSLQVTLMASLFLGEYFGFRIGRRAVLLAAGCCLAVAGNLLRAIILVRLASHGGAAELLAWHDRLGYAETGGIFAALVLAAWLLSLKSCERREAGANISARPEPPDTGSEGWAVLLAYSTIPCIASIWFSLSPGGPIREMQAPLWSIKENTASADWRVEPVPLSPMDIETLGFTSGQTIALEGPQDAGAVIYHFFWKTDASTGYGHTPDHCMVGAGWELEGAPSPVSLRVAGREFPCKLYRFKRDGDEEVVLQSVWYGGDPMISSGEFPYSKGGPRTSRLAMLWEEPRRRGLESLNVYMPPAPDPATQTRIAETLLAQVMVPN